MITRLSTLFLRTLREGASEEELPPSIRDVLLDRAERLSAPAQRLLRTAAVAGRWVPERLLAEVSDIPAGQFYEALREAVDASLLVVDPSGRGYAFQHALSRDACPRHRNVTRRDVASHGSISGDPKVSGSAEPVSIRATWGLFTATT